MGTSDSRVRHSRLFRATPRRDPDAGTSFGSHAAHDRQTVREPDARIFRRYGTAVTPTSSINQTARPRSTGCRAQWQLLAELAVDQERTERARRTSEYEGDTAERHVLYGRAAATRCVRYCLSGRRVGAAS